VITAAAITERIRRLEVLVVNLAREERLKEKDHCFHYVETTGRICHQTFLIPASAGRHRVGILTTVYNRGQGRRGSERVRQKCDNPWISRGNAEVDLRDLFYESIALPLS
jgi:hypothetical protein